MSIVDSTERWLRRYTPLPALGRIPTLRLLYLYARYVRELLQYRDMPGAELVRLSDLQPCVFDRTGTTGIDPHYFYQAIWAGKLIARHAPAQHVDVGSDHRMAGMLSWITRVTFVDVRPLPAGNVDGLTSLAGNLLELPYADGSVPSLSCLHVAEHVGLGRYGEALDPLGSHRAAAELRRVLAPGGNLYFSLPIGRSRVQFNAHRVHSPEQVLAMLPDLELREFSAVDDAGRFVSSANPADYERATYACGLYWFRKPSAGEPSQAALPHLARS